jgi:YesN/AraC family two-component response regulator
LKKALEENYYKAKELKWKDSSALWHEKQGSSESVSQYIVRMKRLARNLDFSPEILHMAKQQGFRPTIHNHVIQKGTANFDEMVKTTKLAESIEDTKTDSTSAALLQMMKRQISAAEKHSYQLEKLSSTGASLQDQHEANRKQFNLAQYSRVLKPTPQNAQRVNYASFSRRAQQDGVERPTNPTQPTGTVCGCSSFSHPPGNCSARGQTSRRCAKISHFARVCKSTRFTAAATTRPQMKQAPAPASDGSADGR